MPGRFRAPELPPRDEPFAVKAIAAPGLAHDPLGDDAIVGRRRDLTRMTAAGVTRTRELVAALAAANDGKRQSRIAD